MHFFRCVNQSESLLSANFVPLLACNSRKLRRLRIIPRRVNTGKYGMIMIISISLPIILACLRVAFSRRSRLFKERLDFFTNYAADELFRIIYCQQGRQTYNSMSQFFFTSSSQYRELIIRLFPCMQYHIFAKFMCTIIPNKLLMIYDIGVCFFCWVFRRESIVDVSFNGKVPACSCFDKHVLRLRTRTGR